MCQFALLLGGWLFKRVMVRTMLKRIWEWQSSHPTREYSTWIISIRKANLQSSCSSNSYSSSLFCVCCWILYSNYREHNTWERNIYWVSACYCNKLFSLDILTDSGIWNSYRFFKNNMHKVTPFLPSFHSMDCQQSDVSW